MKKKVTITYEQALELALPYYSDFYELHEYFNENSRGKDDFWKTFYQSKLQSLGKGCLTAVETVCALFEASDEQVHEDLAALRERRD